MKAIALAQTTPRAGDLAANLAQHLELASRAADEGASLVVFPELSLTGYELDLAAELAHDPQDERLAPLRELASARQLTLVVGAPLLREGRLHLAAFVLEGARERHYTKRHLGTFPASVNPGGPVPPPEPSVFAPGALDPLLAHAGRSAALAICADTGRPSHPAAAAARGAQLYLASMFFTPGELADEHAKLARIAAEHALLVAAANFGGPSGGLPSAGGSAAWAPGGALLAQLPERGAGLLLLEEGDAGWEAKALEL